MAWTPILKRPSDIPAAIARLARENLVLFRSRGLLDFWTTPVVFREEPPGQNLYQNAYEVAAQGWGDCDDFCGWLLAQLWMENIPAYADAIPQGGRLFHVVLWVLINGRWVMVDPSRAKGMK